MTLRWPLTMLMILLLSPAVGAQDIIDTLPKDTAGKPLVVSQIMVLFKAGVEPRPRALVCERIAQRLSKAAGVKLTPVRLFDQEDWQLLQMPAAVTESDSEVYTARLKRLPIVLDAWPNEPTQIISPPGKPQYLKFLDEESDKARFMTWSYFNVPNVEELIVKFVGDGQSQESMLASSAMVEEISRRAGLVLKPISERPDPNFGYEKFALPTRMPQEAAERVCARIKEYARVAYCDPNSVAFGMAITPDDPDLWRQWGLLSDTKGGTRVDEAWSISTGSSDIVVAVLDSGRVPHAELTGRYLAGYDFITDARRSGDGDGRDADPEDRGDWITEPETTDTSSLFFNCVERTAFSITPRSPPDPYFPPPVLTETAGNQTVRYLTSSWHGSHVAGTIGAITNNGTGGAGINWSARILPVRVLGKCGVGVQEDLAAAIQWAAGITTDGIANPYPAKTINMSLTGTGACPTVVQSAIDSAIDRNALVIAAAGNNRRIGGTYWPASCKGVITVVATDSNGKRWPNSNLAAGSSAVISAPGASIFSLSNPGTRQPVAGDAYAGGHALVTGAL